MTKINNFILSLINPTMFVFTNFFAAILSYTGYIFTKHSNLNIYFFILIITFFLFLIVLYKYLYKNIFNKEIFLSNFYWHILIKIIVLSNIIEYIYFGIPFLSLLGIGKTVIYAKYGLPLIHHIAVTSWLIIFIKKKCVLYDIFACLNPILIMNRDLMLFTIFCLIIRNILNKRNSKFVLLAIILVVILFVGLGNLRSGSSALSDTGLPIKSNIIKENNTLLWFFTYISCSYFNFFNNINTKTFNLEFLNINTFPEVYYWFVNLDFFGIYLFFISIFMLLVIFSRYSVINESFKVLYIYLLYNSIMTLFGKKFFTTNTIFVVLLFLFEKFLQYSTIIRKTNESL